MTDKPYNYDEAYFKADAYEMGWCRKCTYPNCPYKNKEEKENTIKGKLARARNKIRNQLEEGEE